MILSTGKLLFQKTGAEKILKFNFILLAIRNIIFAKNYTISFDGCYFIQTNNKRPVHT